MYLHNQDDMQENQATFNMLKRELFYFLDIFKVYKNTAQRSNFLLTMYSAARINYWKIFITSVSNIFFCLFVFLRCSIIVSCFYLSFFIFLFFGCFFLLFFLIIVFCFSFSTFLFFLCLFSDYCLFFFFFLASLFFFLILCESFHC